MTQKLKNRCSVVLKLGDELLGTFRPTQKLFYSLQKKLEPFRTIYFKKCFITLKQENVIMGYYKVNEKTFNEIKEKIAPFKSEGIPSKRVRCIETGQIFKNASKAADWLEFIQETNYRNSDLIKQCCRGKQKTSYGYHWEFVNEL